MLIQEATLSILESHLAYSVSFEKNHRLQWTL